MATIKSCTDLKQSKILSEILSHESADMCYKCIEDDPYDIVCKPYSKWKEEYKGLLVRGDANVIPCWSLAALLDVMRIFTTPTAFSVNLSTPSLTKTKNGYKLTYTGDYTPMINNELGVEAPIESIADNSVDACVEAIIKLHEQKLL